VTASGTKMLGRQSSDESFSQALSAIRRYHCATTAAEQRLVIEWTSPARNVAREFVRLGVGVPWVWSNRMAEFYSETDGFVYELVRWHHSPDRIAWRVLLAEEVGDGADVLCLGDGIGYDACEIAKFRRDARVTSFEYPGHSSAFAQRMIEDLRLANVTQTSVLPNRHFDTVVCLDVLEHVPDPDTFVRNIADHLRPHGTAYVSEACGWVRPTKPTHLRSNLRFAGRILALFEKHGLAYRGSVKRQDTRIRIFEKGGERCPFQSCEFGTTYPGKTPDISSVDFTLRGPPIWRRSWPQQITQ
jgi:SAM-dependent methyltransferase